MERATAKKYILVLITGVVLSLPYGVLANPLQEAGGGPSHQRALNSFAATVRRLKEANAVFHQERRIASLSRPLISTGSVHLEEDGTLVWEQETPFQVLIRITPEAIEETVADSSPHRITRDQNPYLFAFSRAFVSLFTGDMRQLSTLFELEPIQVDSGWHIQLTPKGGNIKKVISTIGVFGADKVERIQIMESGTNHTNIYLTY
jgi:Outer membrane lipoprotein carrier protein LolA-like